MSEFIIKKASKKAKKLRVSFSATSGGGKTLSALRAAYGLTGDWSKICVVDSERDSSSLYALDKRFDIGEFNVITLNPPYHPTRYCNAILAAQKDHDVVIVDSISHEWKGKGGCLELHNKNGGDFRAWGLITPLHDLFINTILTSTAHVFCTVRRKEDYAMVQGERGMTVKKLGLGEETRAGFTYEMDIVFEIDNSTHMATSSKDRTGLFDGKDPFMIDEEVGVILKEWASEGASNLDEAMEKLRNIKSRKELIKVHSAYKNELGKHPDFITLLQLKNKEYPKEVASS